MKKTKVMCISHKGSSKLINQCWSHWASEAIKVFRKI